jgi:glycosyltransferase involved in cell wall biosynthesis
VGGFDETYRIANSDVALCLRAHRAGWRIAYTPFAELTHHEGASRGRSNPVADMIRSAAEVRRLGFDDDPYFHPGLSAVDPIPRLRAADEPNTRENLAREIDRLLATAPQPEASLDLFDDWDVLSAAGLPREFALLPAQSPLSVGDRWSLARWVLNLLRMRPDLRARFPTALSAGPNGAFATWLRAEGGKQFGLPPNSGEYLERLFADDPAARVRQLYFWRDDLRAAFPLGLLPPGRRGLAAWLLRRGRTESDLRLEEIWWFLLSCAEDPAAELVRSYLFTPAWQQAHPCGLTIFGNASFAAWLAEQYSIPLDSSGWLNPASWSTNFGPAEQVRLAYLAREEWRAAHPHALEDEPCAQALLDWLAAPEAGLPATARDWCAARALDATATALVTAGANVLGHFCYPSGLRASVEAMSTALEAAGCPVCRRDMRTEQTDDPHHTDYCGLEVHDITIIHAQPEPFFADAYRRADLAERTPRTYRIAYWYWELDKVPSWWAEKARVVDEIWAATNFITDTLRRIGAAPVRTMFPGVQIPSFTRRPREALGLAGTEGRFVFLFSFHMASIMERKNPLAVMQSFRQAFRSDEPVELVIKTTSSNRHAAQMAELQAAAADARITIMDRVLAPDETLSLMDSCDAYVSLHRSEGLGLTMAEAMLLGKPVIATRYSGNLDFMDDENSLLVDYKLIQLDRPVPPYDASAYWADPSVDHAARLMRRVYENPDWAAELGAKAQFDARTRLSVEAAGQRMAARLAEIKERRRGAEPHWSRWRARC